MLYLRTGANGSCKTLFTLADVRKLQLETGRPVAWNGRFKLNAEKEKEFGWKRIEFKDWQKEPDGTIFLIDECHNDLPKRAASAMVPEHVRMLAEHRARGFDFFLLTQHPMNIDDFVRRLVGAPGWHQHLKRVFGGTNVTRVIQWDAVNPQCEKNGSAKSGQVTTRMQPREVFGWYDSATLHTAKVRVPKQVFILAACALLVPTLAYVVYKRVMPNADAAQVASGQSKGANTATGAGAAGGADRRPMTTSEYVAEYRPRIAGLMHSAPIYDKLTEPKRVPVPAACVQMASKGCKCYTQDATPYPIDQAMCRDLVAHGTFLAFQPEGEKERGAAAAVTARPAGLSESPAPSGLTFIDTLQQAAPVAAAPAEPVPQRIASVKR